MYIKLNKSIQNVWSHKSWFEFADGPIGTNSLAYPVGQKAKVLYHAYVEKNASFDPGSSCTKPD